MEDSRRNVLTKWMDIQMARCALSFCATKPPLTSTMPTSASVTEKTVVATAALRTAEPFSNSRYDHTSSTTTNGRNTPVDTRCAYSIHVLACWASGMAAPQQSGQWLPQPSPEPLARTKAPHTMTSSVYPRSVQEALENRAMPMLLGTQFTRSGHPRPAEAGGPFARYRKLKRCNRA